MGEERRSIELHQRGRPGQAQNRPCGRGSAAATNAEFVKTVGHVAQSIASLADKNRFDLIVMGSRGHGNLANLVLGSVATKVLALTATPVLFVR